MENSISRQNVNVNVRAIVTDPNVTVQYKTKVLQKNVISGVNTLTPAMISEANTKYIIKYDYTLSEDITVPENCILEFDGGSLKNGKIQKSNGSPFSVINSDNHCIFDNVDVRRYSIRNVPKQGLDIRWFGASENNDDNSDAIQRCQFCAGLGGIFVAGMYKVSKPIIFVDGMIIHGKFSTIDCSGFIANADFKTNYPDRGILEDRAFTHIQGVTRYDEFGDIIDIPNYTNGNFWANINIDNIQINCNGNSDFGIVNVCGNECSVIRDVYIGGAVKAGFLHVGAAMKITYDNCSCTCSPTSGIDTNEIINCNGYQIKRPKDWGYGYCIMKHPTNPDFTWDADGGVYLFNGCSGGPIAIFGSRRSVTIVGHKSEQTAPTVLTSSENSGQLANKLNIIGIGGDAPTQYPSILSIVKSPNFKGVYNSEESYSNNDIVLIDYIPKKYNSDSGTFEPFAYVLSNSIVYDKNDNASLTSLILIDGCGFTLNDNNYCGIFESETPYYYGATEREYVAGSNNYKSSYCNFISCEIGRYVNINDGLSIIQSNNKKVALRQEVINGIVSTYARSKKVISQQVNNLGTEYNIIATDNDNIETVVATGSIGYVTGIGFKPCFTVGNSDGLVGFFGSYGFTKQTMTGTVSAEMKSLLSVLDKYGLIKDETTT